MKIVDPLLPRALTVGPRSVLRLTTNDESCRFGRHREILVVASDRSNARQAFASQQACVKDNLAVDRRVTKAQFVVGLNGAVQIRGDKFTDLFRRRKIRFVFEYLVTFDQGL